MQCSTKFGKCYYSLPLLSSLWKSPEMPTVFSPPLRDDGEDGWRCNSFLQDGRKWFKVYKVQLKWDIRRNLGLESQRGLWGFFFENFSKKDLQDGRGVRRGDHLPPHKYIKNTSTCGTPPTKHLLNAGKRPQTSQKARNSPRTWPCG